MATSPIRVIIAKPGLDGHDRGAKVVARTLRDAGMEVTYTGLRQTAAQIVAAVVQEDAQVLGLSTLNGAHDQIFPEVMRLLKEQGLNGVLVFAGGIIPDGDIPVLEAIGIRAVFQSGANTDDMVAFIHADLAAAR